MAASLMQPVWSRGVATIDGYHLLKINASHILLSLAEGKAHRDHHYSGRLQEPQFPKALLLAWD